MDRRLKVASLFCGCGGTDVGMQGDFEFLNKYYASNNIEIVYANDIEKTACNIFERNFGIKVNLRTWVKVKENWLDDTSVVKKFKLQ